MTTSKLSITIGSVDYFVEADCDVTPGEPMVRYYPDGSGFPGSPPEIECTGCTVIECEYPEHGGYGYKDRDGMGELAKLFDRACLAALRDGTHDDELFDGLEDTEDGGYVEYDE